MVGLDRTFSPGEDGQPLTVSIGRMPISHPARIDHGSDTRMQ
jgi:hypothetical protein